MQRPRRRLDRARRQALRDDRPLHRRVAPAPHHQQDRRRRSAAASTSRRRWSTRACPTAAASTRSSRRSRSSGPLLTIRKFAPSAVTIEDLINIGSLSPEAVEFLAALRRGAAEHAHLGRHRLRQDDAAERALGRRSRTTSASSRSRTRPSSSSSSATCSGSRRARRTSRARARSRSAISSATPCACGPTGSSSARSAAPRRSTCSRR